MALPIAHVSSIVPAQIGTFTANPASIAGAASGTVTVSIADVRKNNFVIIAGPNLETGLYISSVGQILNNTDTSNVSFTIFNSTGAPIDAASQTFIYIVL